MSKRIQLSVTDPCHENWDNMTASEQGRYCESCQKQVIDFTNMSDSQLAAFFKKPSSGSLCGRFFDDQLNRDIEIPGKRIPWIRYFFQIVLPAFLVTAKASAQGKAKPPKTAKVSTSERMMLGAIAPLPTLKTLVERVNINGRVLDEEGVGVPFASVMIKGATRGIAADSAGFFKIRDVEFNDKLPITIIVTSVGFEQNETMITGKEELVKTISIQLRNRILNEVVVTAYPTIKGFVRMGGLAVHRKIPDTLAKEIETISSPAEKPAMIKVYPNPVVSGTTINIGCEKLEEGYYTLSLFSQSGQQLKTQQLWIDKEARIINLQIPTVAPGHYILILTNKETGKRFTEKIIVQ